MHPSILLLAFSLPFSLAYTGDITRFNPSKVKWQGYCGTKYSDKDPVVAISEGMMNTTAGTIPDDNPRCGSSIKIWNPVFEQIFEAFIIDVCKGCGLTDLALSPSLFKKVAPYAKGRIPISHGISWGGDAVGG